MTLDRGGYVLEFEDQFDQAELDGHWLRFYAPHWSSREATATRFTTGDGRLRLRIDEDQQPWCPEFDGPIKCSALQTGLFAGPVGSGIGQYRFQPGLVVREEQENVRLHTPQYGLFEIRCRALDDPTAMVGLWMIGYEDEAPEQSGEILICEIFGKNVGAGRAAVGMGIRPFGDPGLTDEFEEVELAIDARDFHIYGAEWTPDLVRFFVDGELVKVSHQSPDYPMQFMLALYEFPGEHSSHPKEFEVDWFRSYRPV